MNLTQELQSFMTEFAMRVPLSRQRVIDHSIRELAASGCCDRAIGEGQAAPDFELPDADGHVVRLADRLAAGPVVLLFVRGIWCPFCNLMLRAYQDRLADLARRGASLLAVSPQSPVQLQRTAERNRLHFPLLCDEACRVAERYGLAYRVDAELEALYREVGHALPDYNAAGDWRLPIPATYLIASDGIVQTAYVNADFRLRLDPDQLVRQLSAEAESLP
jgi:peroxiredoxin